MRTTPTGSAITTAHLIKNDEPSTRHSGAASEMLRLKTLRAVDKEGSKRGIYVFTAND